MRADQITGALLNKAVASFLSQAYRRQVGVRKTPTFHPDQSLPQILAGVHPFEDLSIAQGEAVPVSGAPPRVYALRLGNETYPHMKLALVEAYFHDEFVFSVDRHDTFHFEPSVPGYDAWCELKEINRILKEAIEDAWYREGIPTLRDLRERRFKPTDLVQGMRAEGQTILILDDDESRAEILRNLLAQAGYGVVVGPPGPRPDPTDTAVLQAQERAKGASLRLPAAHCRNASDTLSLSDMVRKNKVALTVLDVSYRTGQGPRVAGALQLNPLTQEIPIVAVYSRRDFGPDPDLFSGALRRPYRTEALLELVAQVLFRHGGSGSGIHKQVDTTLNVDP